MESISSYIHGFSSYVTQSLPSKLTQQQTINPEPVTTIKAKTTAIVSREDVTSITFVRICRVDWDIPENSQKPMCLFLGYRDGFQIWDLTNSDNIEELISIRRDFGTVMAIEVLNS